MFRTETPEMKGLQRSNRSPISQFVNNVQAFQVLHIGFITAASEDDDTVKKTEGLYERRIADQWRQTLQGLEKIVNEDLYHGIVGKHTPFYFPME